MSHHVALLGDSIFDNAAYTRGEPEVVAHLRQLLPSSFRASLLARDGATTAGLPVQLARVDPSVTHLVISVGGNDALGNIDMLNQPVRSTSEALELFGERVQRFERDYRRAIEPVRALGLKTSLCTIYNGNLTDAREAHHARLALMMFNDVIVRTACEHGFSLIELRLVCAAASDYANPIEPSGSGGEKFARAIVAALGLGAGGECSRTFV